MKALSRLASPAGFALVLLLFLFLPFLSVSCEVPGMGTIGADYNGAQLAVGDEPEVEVPAELREMADELPGGGGDNSEPPPDPGVQILAIIVALVMAAGIVAPLLLRARIRLFGAAGIAALAAGLVVVTQVVGQSNLTSQLQEDAQGLSDDEIGAPDIDAVASEMIHTEIGFWFSVIGLALIALISLGAAFKDKILPKPAMAGQAAPGTAPPLPGGFMTDETTPPAAAPVTPPPADGTPEPTPNQATDPKPDGPQST